MTVLVLVTGSYPFAVAAENTFIPQELAVLSEHFDRVVLVPCSIGGDSEKIELENVSVDTSLALALRAPRRKWAQLAQSVVDPMLLRELISNGSIFVRSAGAFRRALGYLVRARITQGWMAGFLRKGPLGDGTTVFYTWWFDAQTLGLARFGVANGASVVTRAHGYDLYESRHSPPYIPFRRCALGLVDRVFPDSSAGARYLVGRFPHFAHKVRVALLGVADPGFLNNQSADGVFRIVSCSFLTPVKRIDLLIRGLAELAREAPDVIVEWTHIGDGPERARLAEQAGSLLPPSIRWALGGYPGKGGVYDYYRTRPVDLFVNVSQSEGTPVSMMEAISAGIPVLCTAVGGNVEVAGADNGLLIPANPSPAQIAAGINTLRANAEELSKRRSASRAKWEEHYNAQKNYSLFAQSLLTDRGACGG